MTIQGGSERLDKILRVLIPLVALITILAMASCTRDATGPIKNLLVSWGAFLVAFILLVGSWLARRPLRRPPLFFAILLAFLALSLISGVLSDHVSHSFVEIRKFLALFVLYFAASQVYRTPGQVRVLMLIVCVGVTLSTAYAIVQLAGWDPFPWEDPNSPIYKELPGTFGNPNYAAHTMILAIIMAVYLAYERRWRWCAGFALVFLAHQLYTGQRGGMVALAGATVLVGSALVLRGRVRRPAMAVGAVLVTVALTLAIGFGALMVYLSFSTGQPYPMRHSFYLRYQGYYGAARMIADNPVLGVGPGNYVIENPRYWTDYEQEWFASQRKMNQHVHNDILELGVESGVGAMALYIALLVIGMVRGLFMGFTEEDAARGRLGWTFAALFCAFLVDGSFGFNLRVPVSALVLFLMMGTMDGMALPYLPEASPEGEKPRRRFRSLVWRMALSKLVLMSAVAESRAFGAEVLLQKGRGAALAKANDAALSLYGRAAELAPWNWLCGVEQAKVAIRMNEPLKAMEYFEHCLERNPTFVIAMVGLARTQMNLALSMPVDRRAEQNELFDKAQANAERALALCPVMTETDDVLGRLASVRAMSLHGESGDDASDKARVDAWRDADGHLSKAIEYGSNGAGQLYSMLAQARIILQDMNGAEHALFKALEADPTNQEVWGLVTRYARRFNRPDLMRDLLRLHIARLDKTDQKGKEAAARLWLAMAELRQALYADPDAAADAYAQAVRLAPGMPEAWEPFARFSKQARRGDAFKQAVLGAGRALGESSETAPPVQAAAMVWERGADAIPEAAGLLASAIKKQQSSATKDALIAEFGWSAEVLLVETERAGANLENRGVALLNLGVVLSLLGQDKMADLVFAAAMPALPAPQQALCAKEHGDVLSRLGRHVEAIAIMKKAVDLSPGDLSMRHAFAKALSLGGQSDMARREYERILKSPTLSPGTRRAIQGELAAIGG